MLSDSTPLLSHSFSMKAMLALSTVQDVTEEATLFCKVPQAGWGKVEKVLSQVTVAALIQGQGCPRRWSAVGSEMIQGKPKAVLFWGIVLSNNCGYFEEKTKQHLFKQWLRCGVRTQPESVRNALQVLL